MILFSVIILDKVLEGTLFTFKKKEKEKKKSDTCPLKNGQFSFK